eukprot:CAMPEP_0202371256 /NCGR_PEP_ID=MMETSP1127-20130417/2692_1 /ASSEMBLY_ACC=CAM_ASM_000462 /TAXON_ID=3047 /ORGANISM="Dunaliella tertiolecta, Strain CCMP1320" /LENGTH=76 /DNA_ID=CAMNT_0048967437 /DNA_START=79 /DNA_END=309 /DNA_ORIENTATION=+
MGSLVLVPAQGLRRRNWYTKLVKDQPCQPLCCFKNPQSSSQEQLTLLACCCSPRCCHPEAVALSHSSNQAKSSRRT